MAQRFDWTEEVKQRMMQMLNDGLSANQVGAALGISRNAVIGKCLRLGHNIGDLNGFNAGKRRMALGIRILNKKTERPIFKYKKIKPQLEAPTPIVLAPSISIVVPKPNKLKVPATAICLMELTPYTCRWPMWGEPHEKKLFCGETITPRQVYCEHHAKVASREGFYSGKKNDPSVPFLTKNRRLKSKVMIA